MENEATMMLLSGVGRLMFVLIAMLALWAMLHLLDRLSGHPFEEVMEKIKGDPLATAIYYGARIVGICIGVGLVFS